MAKQVKFTPVIFLTSLLVLLASASGKCATCEYIQIYAPFSPVTNTAIIWLKK
jgi:hypothetical protein